MAMLDWIAVANDLEFQAKVRYCCTKACIDIFGEEVGSGLTAAQHKRRVELARYTLPAGPPQGMYWAVITNGTIQTKIDAAQSYDDDLQFVVHSVWDDVAGYDPEMDEP